MTASQHAGPNPSPSTSPRSDSDGRDRLRILHLGFEDFRRPWAGGGSHRTHSVNRILAERHDITVLCARYPGARARCEDGVRYEHIGPRVLPGRTGHFLSLLGYFAALPRAVRRADADLVVEDFASPFGSVGVPRWTDIPAVGIVQWLFAKDKAEQYHLPFDRVETAGVRSHDTMLAVSADLAERLQRMNPDAEVHVVHNGVDEEVRDAPVFPSDREDFAYLGRLEIAQKGLDVLLDAFGNVSRNSSANLVLGGDGTDRDALQARVRALGLADRVTFRGRVAGREKIRLLDSARALLVPSRYETFGIVAAEALARRTPVVAFDIPCLREVVSGGSGMLVPTRDGTFASSDFADAVLTLARDSGLARRMGDRGPAAVERFRWDAAASLQEAHYTAAVGKGRRSGSRRHG